ncbi:GDP-mannose 4,6-dehydratase [Micromonospora sp. WMMD1102]|uniref:GDP-mannose 4,6-dehydratase n=1 Tax=Micromonospora sp. WMMD1102 TaxID=3016105 RepID=UPI0024158562|nr:GDP-mannose 4,6-dehydratase [Micromonospora sp. WMMD1102]MDG4784352.1 GDP-mannose 4,6-dehydratase [Micromonospora sp. WMMD1102]MDG4784425.1 GDP-mannose 4,6-dehydratase [Micromonospora sp. WMMD1102]
MRALITGVTGQDGSYLAEQLAADGHEVYGLIRGQRNPRRAWIEGLVPGIRLVDGDLLDQSSLQHVLAAVRPEVVYNLGALTYVGMSWQQPAVMTEVTGLGVLRLLEAIRVVDPAIRLVHASSSEMFGAVREMPQNELTPFNPRSPYGVAKVFAHHTVVNYRESYGLHASTAMMFNHESPRRGPEFVTRKVSLAAAAIATGRQFRLSLGNLDARRDWGWAPDYMRALPLMAARPEPGDWVLATGETRSVRELVETAFAVAGLAWRRYVRVDPALYRPADVEVLCGDASKAAAELNWKPTVGFAELVARLVDHDLREAR